MDPIDFGRQRSKVKVKIDKLLYASSSNLAYMLAIVRELTLLILEVTGQRSMSQ